MLCSIWFCVLWPLSVFCYVYFLRGFVSLPFGFKLVFKLFEAAQASSRRCIACSCAQCKALRWSFAQASLQLGDVLLAVVSHAEVTGGDGH